jgi:hypothetical protein
MSMMADAIDDATNTGLKGVAGAYGRNWQALCAYTHSGAHQVQRWNLTESSIEPKYDEAELCELVRFTGEIALMAGLSTAWLSCDQALVPSLTEKLLSFRADQEGG